MAFLETPRFPESISVGATGGANFKTDIVTVSSGFEQRNVTWAEARASYDVSHSVKENEDLYAIIKFFRAVKGRAHGFRFKDWADYQCDTTEGILEEGVGTGKPSYQLVKKYAAGALYDVRDIRKPVAGTVKVYRNSILQTLTTNYTIDTTTGIITFVADATSSVDSNNVKTITAITNANPAVVTTSVAHGFVTGDKVKITSVSGMTQVNNLYFTVTVINTTQFSLGVDSSAYGTYTSGGTVTKFGITQTNPVRVNDTAHGFSNGDIIYINGALGMTQVNGKAFTVTNATTDYFELSGIDGTGYSAYISSASVYQYPQPTDILTWEGEFDVPVRFDTDKIEVELISSNLQGWSSIPIIEIRT